MAKDGSGFPEIEEYTKKLDTNPESLVFVPLAEAYRKSGMLDEAIDTCQKGLKHHPTYMSARMVLGRSLMEKGMMQEAAEEFKKVASADVNNIMAHSLLAQINMKQQQYAEAIKEYQKVLSLNPDDITAQEMLNKALELASQHNKAKTNAEPTVKEGEKKQNLNKAEELSKQGDIDNAIKIYQLILEADPENLVVRQRLKDLELQKARSAGATKNDRATDSNTGGYKEYRDNDKITSDDILSVMKDTAPKSTPTSKPAPAPPPPVNTPKPVSPSKPTGLPQPAAPPKPAAAPTPPAKVPASPAKAPEPAADSIKNSVPALQKLIQTDGILGSMLLNLEGKVLASVFNNLPKDEKEIAGLVSTIFGKTEKSVQAMDYGKQVNQILITGEKGQIIFSKIGHRILLILADENINLGKMRLAMKDVVAALRQS